MKKGDKVKITKPGKFTGLIGSIISISYSVDLGVCGIWSFKDDEVVVDGKESAGEGVKIASKENVEPNVKVDKPVKVKKVVSNKPKRAYHKKTK